MRNKKIEKEEFENQIVDEVLKDFEERQFERKSFESTWQLNINFFLGNQYCYVSPAGDIIENGKQYFWQEKEVYNHIANIIELRQSKLSRVRPTLTVIPFSDDERDIACAKTSKKILKAVSHNLNISKILSKGTMWSEICGTAFYKVDWNNNLGKVVGLNPAGGAIKEGDVEVSVVSPFEIYPDSSTYNSIEDCMSIIYARSFHKDTVKNIWGVDVEGKNLDVYSLDGLSISGGLGYTSISNSMAKKVKKDQVVVLEKYEKPTIEYPNGRLIIVAGNKLVYNGELPYINKAENKRGFPFIRQVSIPTPNCFWGMSVIERCIPIQRAFNAVKNRKHEFMNRLTMGILAVEDGSVDVENLEEEGLSPGKVLIYRQGANGPKMLCSDNLPIDFKNEEEALLNEFKTVSGVNDFLNQSNLSYGNISGVALQLMIEQDDVKLSTSSEEIRYSAQEIAKQILRLYKQYAKLQHTSKIIGDNGTIELFYWSSSDINSEEVMFETENEINETLAQKRSMIFELLNSGLLADENGKITNTMRGKLLEQLGFGIWEATQDIKALQTKNASKENLQLLMSGKIEDPRDIDDNEVHIQEHISFILGNEFEKSKLKNSDVERLMLEHIRKHKNLIKNENEDKE